MWLLPSSRPHIIAHLLKLDGIGFCSVVPHILFRRLNFDDGGSSGRSQETSSISVNF
jgi:hypothetical protein